MQLVPALARRHPRVTLGLLVLGAGLLVFGFVWFQPHKLFLDDRVDEAVPGVPAAAAASEGAPPEPAGGAEAPAGPVTLAEGAVGPVNHGPASGTAIALETPRGRFLRLEDLAVDNGPDLRVYLTSVPAERAISDEESILDDIVDLGVLKGNIGSSNYRLPGDLDLDRYSTVVVWCRRFTVAFAVAAL